MVKQLARDRVRAQGSFRTLVLDLVVLRVCVSSKLGEADVQSEKEPHFTRLLGNVSLNGFWSSGF